MKAFLLDHPSTAVSLDALSALGVLYWKLDGDNYTADLERICNERNYQNRDFVKLTRDLQGLEDKLKTFYREHLHDDEEIRFCLDGEGLFDVRNEKDEWIRIVVNKGDMIVLPKGIYHRFTLTHARYIHAMRLFQNAPKWEAIFRTENSA